MSLVDKIKLDDPVGAIGLEINITNKIQMFHDILGEDAKYLSDGEEFGSQELFNTLNNKKSY